MAASADIRVATATFNNGSLDCGTFSENLTTAFFTASGLTPGASAEAPEYCIKNVGSQTVTLSVLADSLTDVDYACTGDEQLHGDNTCGSDGDGDGDTGDGTGDGSLY